MVKELERYKAEGADNVVFLLYNIPYEPPHGHSLGTAMYIMDRV
jgi:hypothetical protein